MRIRGNEEWLRALRTDGIAQVEALRDLREVILRVTLAYLAGHGHGRRSRTQGEIRPLAEDCTQEALLTILQKLETFRGESHFTTWAYKIALHRLLGELRRQRWREVSLDAPQIGKALPAWPIEEAPSSNPETALQQAEVWRVLKGIIERDLTDRQRAVLIAHVFQGMPLDLAAEWLGTNRDNVYKILHDARKKLKGSLVEHGLTQKEIFDVFEG